MKSNVLPSVVMRSEAVDIVDTGIVTMYKCIHYRLHSFVCVCEDSLLPKVVNLNGKMFRDPNATVKIERMAEEEGRQRRIGRMSR